MVIASRRNKSHQETWKAFRVSHRGLHQFGSTNLQNRISQFGLRNGKLNLSRCAIKRPGENRAASLAGARVNCKVAMQTKTQLPALIYVPRALHAAKRKKVQWGGNKFEPWHCNKSALGRCKKKTLIARVRYKRSQPEKHLFGPNLEQ
jgi:hypothetical protein